MRNTHEKSQNLIQIKMISVKRGLGRNIKNARKDRGLTQYEAAILSQIDYKYYQLLESKNSPWDSRLSTYYKIAKTLKTTLSRLFANIEFIGLTYIMLCVASEHLGIL
jgi:transcriptional regulator with XRE-family HTH domain